MKLLQFKLKRLVASIALLGLCFCWIQWPRQTAQQFVRNPHEFAWSTDDPGSALSLSDMQDIVANPDLAELTPYPRTWLEIIKGEQDFHFNLAEFRVVRGAVPCGPKNSAILYVRDVGGFGSHGF